MMDKELHKQAGTLDDIKRSGEKLWENTDGAGLAALAGLGGLAGYLYDQSTKKRTSSLLRSLLLTGGGAALGAGAYGLTKALTADKPLFQSPASSDDSEPLVGGVLPGLAGIPAAALGAVGAEKLHELIGWTGAKARAVAKAQKIVNDAGKQGLPAGDLRQRDLDAKLRAWRRARRVAPWGSAYPEMFKGVFSRGGGLSRLKTNIQNFNQRQLRHGPVRGKYSLVRGYTPSPGVIGGALAAAAVASPWFRAKVADMMVDY